MTANSLGDVLQTRRHIVEMASGQAPSARNGVTAVNA